MFYARLFIWFAAALLAALCASAQPTVKADLDAPFESSDDSQVKLEAHEIYTDAHCSIYCSATPDTVYASSELDSSANHNYNAVNVFDADTLTAWADGSAGPGEGESISLCLNTSINQMHTSLKITQIVLMNGYFKTEALWRANGRVRQMALFVNGKLHCFIDFLDERLLQSAEIPPVNLWEAPRTTLRFVIMDVYPGEKYDDVCITELGYRGVGHH